MRLSRLEKHIVAAAAVAAGVATVDGILGRDMLRIGD
jgi:hypothetical protein